MLSPPKIHGMGVGAAIANSNNNSTNDGDYPDLAKSSSQITARHSP